MPRDIITQLKKLRTEPRAGYVGEEVRARGREKLMAAIAVQKEDQHSVWAPAATFEFIRFTISDLLAKPVTALASFAVLVLGGLTTVSAASQSLPGDALYGVKLVSERAQLQLTSADKKAVLHTEFAGRRLQELVELTNGSAPDQKLVASTVDAFKREVNSATQEIQHLPTGQSASVLAQVSAVNAKINDLSDSIAQTSTTPAISDDIQSTTASAGNAVVDTAVGVYENQPKPTSGDELKKLFQTSMNKIIQRRTLSIGRLSVIETNTKFYKVSSRRETGALRSRIDVINDKLSEASGFVAAGGYRAAFEDLRDVEDLLTSLESELSAIEFDLIEANAEPMIDIPVPVDPSASPATEPVSDDAAQTP